MDLRELMDARNNIRNVTVIAHVGSGKSTFMDCLVADAAKETGRAGHVTDTRADEVERRISIKSTAMSLTYNVNEDDLRSFQGQSDGTWFLVNLIDSPGHVDFSSEVTAALRLSDGALVTIDCLEGFCARTETVLRQALCEKICPVVVMNKLDRLFELQYDGEKAYSMFQRALDNLNAVIGTYEGLGHMLVSPEKGNVAFGAGLYRWAFCLKDFAKMYAVRFGVTESKMLERLWGDHFFDSHTKKWTRHNTGSTTCKRGFVHFCYEPIKRISNACLNGEPILWNLLEKVGVSVDHHVKELTGKRLMKCVMQRWLPASKSLIEMMIFHLPSHTAQKYRYTDLYSGPLDDPYARAIETCDPSGPLMVYISKMIPSSDKGRFVCFGRVFSGR